MSIIKVYARKKEIMHLKEVHSKIVEQLTFIIISYINFSKNLFFSVFNKKCKHLIINRIGKLNWIIDIKNFIE